MNDLEQYRRNKGLTDIYINMYMNGKSRGAKRLSDLTWMYTYNGATRYFKIGDLHREDGPACTDIHGREEYWLDGESLTKDEWRNKMLVRNLTPKTNKIFGQILRDID